MNVKKWLSLMIASVMVAVLLAACGGGNNHAADSGNNNDTGKGGKSSESNEVNVFTARHYEVDQQLFDEFTKQTGIKVNVVKDQAETLIERIKREGESTQADLFITVDGGILANAKENGILQPVTSPVIEENVPAEYRDRENYWIGMATRARVIVYSKDRVNPEELSTYEDLATEKWKGKLLVRSSGSLYNQSLMASLIELNGEEQAAEWAKGIAANLAQEPKGGDRDQAKAIVAGIGDVAIMNTYYVGLLATSKDPEEVKVAEQIGVFFPNQETTGTHINISGIGLTKHSKNKENAIKLIEYITSVEAQQIITNVNFEFPVNPKAEKADFLKSWGEFKHQQLDFDVLGKHNRKAIELMTQAGWK